VCLYLYLTSLSVIRSYFLPDFYRTKTATVGRTISCMLSYSAGVWDSGEGVKGSGRTRGGEGGEKGEVFMKSIPPNDVQEEALQPKSQLRSASDIIFSNLNGLCGIWTFQKTPCYLPSTPSTPSTPSLLPFLPVCPFVFPFSSLPLSPFFFNFSLHSFC
jgi:hypothetical protein